MQKKYPPYDISPEDLWAKIIETPRPIMHIDFPRLDKEGNAVDRLTLMILTKEDFYRSRINVEEDVSKLLIKNKINNANSEFKESIKQQRYQYEILFRCCRRYNDINRSFFPSIEDIIDLYPEEILSLLNSFYKFQNRFGPINLNENEMEEWLRILTIGGSYSLRFELMGANENVNETFGIPTSQLTEGQIMAWLAARKYFLDKQKYNS